ncbi:MAG: TIGR01212 family radical SAM protein [Bacilli bacterium]|nr:TIGR01212 family radical SAM protein [Bacilli bacterium]
MNNPYKYSKTNKRYYTFDYYLKEAYKSKVAKLPLDASFTCPNRDGKVGIGGCSFCNGVGSYGLENNQLSLVEQFDVAKQVMLHKWPNAKFIAYFQAFTNTYGSVEELKAIYEPFIKRDDVVALTIATRPDCLEQDILDYLATLQARKPLYVELGLQTTFDKSAASFNRGYDYKVFLKAVNELRKRGIFTVVHLINGLPNETKNMQLTNVRRLAALDIQGIKIHSLNILKDTKLAKDYALKPFKIMNVDEYTSLVVQQLELLREDIVVERISADAKEEELIAPTWSSKKTIVANEIDKKMAALNTVQGAKYQKISEAVSFSHELILTNPNFNVAIDATLGNGHDSEYLTALFNEVYAFDIQPLAIRRSQKLLQDIANITIIQDSFINFTKYVHKKVDLVLYNLGFLPGTSHKIRTDAKTTIESIKVAKTLLNNDGTIIIVAYTQHDNGAEYQALLEYLKTAPFTVQLHPNFEYERIIVLKPLPKL